jgi:hypothetical protein
MPSSPASAAAALASNPLFFDLRSSSNRSSTVDAQKNFVTVTGRDWPIRLMRLTN